MERTTMSEDEFYILESGSVVGNCAMWWRPEGRGYTCDLSDAGKYTADQAKRLRPSDVPVPCAVADAAAVRHVRFDGQALAEYVARGRKL